MISPNSAARSSLEEMLDSLRRRDAGENSTDLPPALPSRPTSKARLPKRLIQAKIAIQNVSSSFHSTSNRKQDVNCISKDSGKLHYVVPLDYFIKNNLGVWCKAQKNDQWELAKIVSTANEEANAMLLDGNVIKICTRELLPANPEILDGVDDLVELCYLNKPSVLHNLRYRYNRDVIYSKAGPVLLAFNPFKDVNIYGNDFVTAYKEKVLDSPHVYAVADAAYNNMMKDGGNQSIIISGEKGSGKTETAKFAMQYLASVGSQNCEMKPKLIATSCILEAFGNSKTSTNWNSSRFGKLVDIHYNAEGTISGACIQTYLLEKSRVSQICRGERSYHVFYQICAGAPPALKDMLNLKMSSEYKFLNQSGCLKINGVDDAHNFKLLADAFDTVGISCQDQENVFQLLAAVLWLGNVSFEVMNQDEHVKPVVDEASRSAARLMGCKMDELVMVLSTNRTRNMSEPLTLQQATDKRDALAALVYESLFNWLVEELNTSLKGDGQHTRNSISILDSCGFESLQKNSFQQLLMNYADERLQQHFIRHLCKLEQEEYDLEGIHWKRVEFEDNQECLDLFEKKPIGLVSILSEGSNSSKATDDTLTDKFIRDLSYNTCFTCEKGAFRVRHYAREVQYDALGLFKQNRDTLLFDTFHLLSSCKKPLNRSACNVMNQVQASGQSIGAKFMDHLIKLIQQMENSKQHFIRCIKPNTKKLPGIYESDIVWEQLRCCQIMEIVQISKSRYPFCFTHQEFASRFDCLLSENISYMDPLSTSVAILKQHRIPTIMYQVGFTKLFFRGQVEVLENLRQEVLSGTRELKNCFLGGRVLDCHELKRRIVTLQSFVRGENVRREFNALKNRKQWVAESSLNQHMTTIVHIQSVVRGWLARKHFNHLRRWKKLTFDRSRSSRRSYSKIKNSELKDLSEENNVEIVPQNVEELQKRVAKAESLLTEKDLENGSLRVKIRQLETRWFEYESKMKVVEETWQSQMSSLQVNLAAAKKTLGSHLQTGRPDDSLSPNYYDSKDNISGIQTPAQMTPGNRGVMADTIDFLTKEFEQRKHNFDHDAKIVVKKEIEDYNSLKKKFEMWRKEYKNRLRELKPRLVKGVHAGGHRQTRNWWGKFNIV